jgi:hypothetical protein
MLALVGNEDLRDDIAVLMFHLLERTSQPG